MKGAGSFEAIFSNRSSLRANGPNSFPSKYTEKVVFYLIRLKLAQFLEISKKISWEFIVEKGKGG